MPIHFNYKIDELDFQIELPKKTTLSFGDDICLSKDFNDITLTKSWYDKGYSVIDSEPFFNIEKTKSSLFNCIYKICLEEGVKADKDNFKLEHYHKYVDAEQHSKIIKKTRDLTPQDFSFDIDMFLRAANSYFKHDLSWSNPGEYNPKIITRINMPQSNNFNPAHKDIYQIYDQTKKIPPMVNIWIPICGVSDGVGLPVSPGSHLINESKVFRTKAGATVNGIKYNVNCIKDWDARNDLVTICPNETQMLVFSSFLIHGLAQNLHQDTTRISLEFRLFG
tara:strand:- start:938 stop:1774 length:837 start_codon:yes stop_codon:yes gene_type:complete